MPSPQTVEQMLGDPMHLYPYSILQVEEQPSHDRVFWLSHCSFPTMCPSPQTSMRRADEEEEEREEEPSEDEAPEEEEWEVEDWEEAPDALEKDREEEESEGSRHIHCAQIVPVGQSAATSHCSSGIFRPSPQMGEQTLGQLAVVSSWKIGKREATKDLMTSQGPRATVVGQTGAHCQPNSTVQSLAHPSPEDASPSSQISVPTINPSPQTGAH